MNASQITAGEKAREYLRHARTFLGEATFHLSHAGLQARQAESYRIYDLVMALEEKVYDESAKRLEKEEATMS